MGINRPKLVDCSRKDVIKALRKLKGFTITEGGKHTKVTHDATGQVSVLPRSNPISKGVMKSFVKKYLIKKCNIPEKEIYEHLWC